MSRSTIQEKLSGKSALNLTQILAIVDALAEHAQSIGAPLPKHEIDRQTWQDRIAASSKTSSSKRVPLLPDASTPQGIEWNIEPLREAQMEDLIDLILDYRSKPVGEWLPRVLRAMMLAEMTVTDFLKKAAEDSPQGVINTIKALHEEFPYQFEEPWETRKNPENEQTVGFLVHFAAEQHGASAAPAIVVGLRRAYLGVYVENFLTRIGTWFHAQDIEKSVNQLRAAALAKDATSVLTGVAERQHNRIFEVVAYLQEKGRARDAKTILRTVGKRSLYQLRFVILDFNKNGASEETLIEIARGVSFEHRAEFIENFTEWGLTDFTKALQRASDEPPF